MRQPTKLGPSADRAHARQIQRATAPRLPRSIAATRLWRAKPQSRKAAELSCLCVLAAWRDLAPAAPRRDAHTTTGSPNPERHRRRPVSPGVMPNAPSGPRPRREPNPERHRLRRVTSSSLGSTLRGQVVVAARSMREAREIVAKIKPLARLGCLGAVGAAHSAGRVWALAARRCTLRPNP